MALRQDLVMRMIEQLGQAFRAGRRAGRRRHLRDLEDVEDVEAAIAGALHTRSAPTSRCSDPGRSRSATTRWPGGWGCCMRCWHAITPTPARASARWRWPPPGCPGPIWTRCPRRLRRCSRGSSSEPPAPTTSSPRSTPCSSSCAGAPTDLTGAEDHLFAALERGAPETLRARGRQLVYAELLEREDRWLEAHDLPRTELLDALEDLEHV